jgi:Domain of unknown function (DUF4265)
MNRDMTKITIKLEDTAAHGFSTESMWGERLSSNEFRICNVPFFAYGISIDDVVAVAESPEGLVLDRVLKRSGHSTFRVVVDKSVSEEQFAELWKPLSSLGCSYESYDEPRDVRLFAIDVPPSARLDEVTLRLQAGEDKGVWEYEEGFLISKSNSSGENIS